jgi:signal transduction histidine kinase
VTDDQPRRYLRHAATGLDRGASLVRRMLNFARRQDTAPEALDLAALLGNLADFVRVTVGAGVEVATDLPEPGGGPALVRADATQIELAVVNLALNARDAMPGGGTITLSVVERTLATDEPDLAAGCYAVLEVRDSGAGMDEATLARATEPFFTTKAPGKGTGLGLAMVRGLAVQTGGALRLSSRPGVGTTVALWLPLDAGGISVMAVASGTG